MTHIGWMINVTKILPELSELSNHDYYGIIMYLLFNIIIYIYISLKKILFFIYIGNYMDLILYKPCFGEMKYNFPIKKFRALSVCQDTLEVYVLYLLLIFYQQILRIFFYIIK